MAYRYDRDAGGHQRRRVAFALVAQDVQLGRDDDGRRQAREVRPERIDVRVRAIHGDRRERVPEESHLVTVQAVVVELGVDHRRIEGGADQDLRRYRAPGVALAAGHHRRELATRRVAGHRDRARAGAAQPTDSRLDVVERGRKGRLRGAAVAHGQDRPPRGLGEMPAETVVGVEIAHHPAATVRV